MLKNFNLKLTNSNGFNVYKVEGYDLEIIETKSMNGEFYLLSTKEVLNVMDYFKVLDKVRKIKIHNTKLLNVQAFVRRKAIMSKEFDMNLYAVSELADNRFGIRNERKNTLFTLIHEIAHLKGILDENLADKFAVEHIDELWKKSIKE